MPRAANAHKRSGPAIDPDAARPDTGAAAQQRVIRTSAAGTSRPATQAANSVFALARKPAPAKRGPSIDPLTVPIKHGVPVPPPAIGTGRASRYAELWARMAKGDCVELPDRQAHGLTAYAKKSKQSFASRRTGAGMKTVWRMS